MDLLGEISSLLTFLTAVKTAQICYWAQVEAVVSAPRGTGEK